MAALSETKGNSVTFLWKLKAV